MKRVETIATPDLHYLCTFRPEPDGGFTVRCPAFPEIVSYGETMDDARRNAREAIELCLEVYRDEGRPIPASESTQRRIVEEFVPVTLARG